jgi:hypothetical protein
MSNASISELPSSKASGPGLRHVARVLLVLACLCFAGVTALRLRHNTGELFVSDGYFYYSYLPSWWIDHDVDLTNQYRHRPEETVFYGQVSPVTGKPGNPYAIGMAVFLTPAFWIARVLNGFQGDPWSVRYQLPVYTGAFLLSVAGVGLTWYFLRRYFSARTALAAAILTLLASGWSAYLFFEPNFSHGMAAFATALFTLLLLRAGEDPRPGRVLAAGAALGLVSLVRTQNVLLVLLVPFVIDWKQWRAYLLLGTAAAITFVPQMLAWHAVYGKWLGIPQGQGYMQWHRPMILATLFSTNHGLFMWAPALFLAALGFGMAPPQVKRLTVGACLFLLCELYVNSVVKDWWCNGAFGMRRMVDYTPLFALGMASLLQRLPRGPLVRSGCAAMCALLVLGNWVLLARYYSHDLPAMGEVGIRRLWGETLVYPFRLLQRPGLGTGKLPDRLAPVLAPVRMAPSRRPDLPTATELDCVVALMPRRGPETR